MKNIKFCYRCLDFLDLQEEIFKHTTKRMYDRCDLCGKETAVYVMDESEKIVNRLRRKQPKSLTIG